MEFRDLKKQYQMHRQELDMAVQEVLCEANFISGRHVWELEKKLAEYVGVKHCITCGNGTDALQLALMAWNIGPGDAVFVPDFTFFSSGEVIAAIGATPVFVDIDERTFNISTQSLEKAIEKVDCDTELTPKVIIAVDLFGQPADYERISQIAERYHMYVLEDGAQGFGGSIDGRKACSFGDISTTSFFPAKPLGCYGDGGAVFTDNDMYAEVLRSLCVHGKGSDKYDNVRIGMNSRLDTLQAAILLKKIDFFEKEVEQCNLIADQYTQRLKSMVTTPLILPQMISSWAQYTIQFKNFEQREHIMKSLAEEGIPTAIYYRKPMHQQKAFIGKILKVTECAVTERICNVCLSLPMHPYLTMEEIEIICSKMKMFFDGEINDR